MTDARRFYESSNPPNPAVLSNNESKEESEADRSNGKLLHAASKNNQVIS